MDAGLWERRVCCQPVLGWTLPGGAVTGGCVSQVVCSPIPTPEPAVPSPLSQPTGNNLFFSFSGS